MKKQPTEEATLKTGAYPLESLREIIRAAVERKAVVRITLPRTWCRELAANVPILSPEATRYIDLLDAPDSQFTKADTFVLETGKHHFAWKK